MPLMSGNLIRNLLGGPVTRPYPLVKRRPFPRTRARLLYDPARCTYCGICANICPANAIAMKEERDSLSIERIYDSFSCIYCARCAEFCPDSALQMDVVYLESADAKTLTSSSSR
ncbi:MAG: 4Fe-4S binding protein [Candidatus Desulforudis sp.]|nr:4Fe-4S binding protein [Desulforudis sp.]